MLITLVVVICSGDICLERVVTDSNQSGITSLSCSAIGQSAIADWLSRGSYNSWTLRGYRCVSGPYVPRRDA